tara:strand:+ start:33852 stop:34025 length:174 start_codon:yes stop_codon:yes gene_type:complete
LGVEMNPEYAQTFLFENDFAALIPNLDESSFEEGILKDILKRAFARLSVFLQITSRP